LSRLWFDIHAFLRRGEPGDFCCMFCCLSQGHTEKPNFHPQWWLGWLVGFYQVWTKISCWFFVQNIYHPFSWQAIQTLLQLKHNSSALARLAKTNLVLWRVQTCTYGQQHSPSTTEWLTLQCCQSHYLIVRPWMYPCVWVGIAVTLKYYACVSDSSIGQILPMNISMRS
jgi:hypothetical protein